MTVSNAGVVTANSFVGLNSSSVTATGSTTARTLANRFADVVNVKDFGAVGDGVANDTAAFQAAINSFPINAKGTIIIPSGTYNISGTINYNSINILFLKYNNATIIGNPNQIYGILDILSPVFGSQGYLAHNFPPGFNVASSSSSNLCLIRGSATNPDNTTQYARNALFIETHSNNSSTIAQSVWGAATKKTGMVSEFVVEPGFYGEANSGAFRAYSTTPCTLDNFALVGLAAIGQSNPGVGFKKSNCWGMNAIAAHTSGTGGGTNLVGIEADIIPNETATPYAIPGNPFATNYTGYWAQADAKDTIECNTAFLATTTNSLKGWQNFLAGGGACSWWQIATSTTVNNPNARGISLDTTWAGDTCHIIQCTTGAVGSKAFQFLVTGDPNESVYIRVGGALKKVYQDAPDSAGTGYRALRVVN
jgi:hypothetical protein